MRCNTTLNKNFSFLFLTAVEKCILTYCELAWIFLFTIAHVHTVAAGTEAMEKPRWGWLINF